MDEATISTRRRRFSVEEYYRMIEVGIFAENERLELIEGDIVEMGPPSLRHSLCVAMLMERLTRAIDERAHIWPANPVRFSRDTEPQPDIVFIRGPLTRYTEHPGPADVMFLVEVSDDSYHFDRDVKLDLYARAGVPEVWIVDLRRDVIELFREPSAAGYAATHRVERGGTLAPVAFPDVMLQTADILPPA